MKKYILTALLLTATACTPMQEETAINVADGISSVATAAGAAGVPFAGAVPVVVGLLTSLYAVAKGQKTEKLKKEANYHAIKAIDEGAKELSAMLKDGTLSAAEAAVALEKLSIGTAKTVHSAYGVYDLIKKDIEKLKAKKEITEG